MSLRPVDQIKAEVLANWWSYDIADPVGLYRLVLASGPAEAATPACPTAGGKTCVFPFVTSGKTWNSLNFRAMFLKTVLDSSLLISFVAGESVSECQAYNGRSYCATSLKSTGKYATWDYCVDIKCPVIGKTLRWDDKCL